MMTKLIPPVINNNGTSVDELLSQQRHVTDALWEAIIAMRDATPHGQDYQTLDPSVGAAARNAHGINITVLQDMLDQYTRQAIAILQQKR